jgi:hypothetical protein
VSRFRVGYVYGTYFKMFRYRENVLWKKHGDVDHRLGELGYFAGTADDPNYVPTNYDLWRDQKWAEWMGENNNPIHRQIHDWLGNVYWYQNFNARWSDTRLTRLWNEGYHVRNELDAFMATLTTPPFPPTDPDDDGDGLKESQEAELGTNPALADTDGGGVGDGTEYWDNRTNPLDPSDDGPLSATP